ncbi:hypothetical protein [Bradyrhizobium sp. BR 10289]|uniref:hypothetical protein n=1 Tax=Bradyrhizobium sp. BR 10289 TaxID=2749993 RepID=UPI001C6490F5|nr:hypothetical protein [Bradyrhizobium sp. BR 10289]MBW7974201.1 hypothetical protein [Bradyrhizobium sp. BR 10289]
MTAMNEISAFIDHFIEIALPGRQDLCEALCQDRIPCLGIRLVAAAVSVATPPGSVNTQDLVVLLYLVFAVAALRLAHVVATLSDCCLATRRILLKATSVAKGFLQTGCSAPAHFGRAR